MFKDPASGSGRSAGDVFKERPVGGAGTVGSQYGDASGRLFDSMPQGKKDYIRPEEVYKLGGGRR